jgi:DNA modification methylase
MQTQQLPLFTFQQVEQVDNQEWGTFKDSLRAPIHNWFTYPAGFSYKAVEASLKANHICVGDTVYDPFMGSGTTNVTAKKLGINSYGVEAHPFVFKIAKAKLCWNISRVSVLDALRRIKVAVRSQNGKPVQSVKKQLEATFPELVLKCYDDKALMDLLLIRDAIANLELRSELTDFFFVGLTGLLREVSLAETGWPYIAPKKQKSSSINKDVSLEFSRRIRQMIDDVEVMVGEANEHYAESYHEIFNADSRDTALLIPDHCVDHVFTSPPYLNNFDYADRTRLELYFWGEAKSWGDISKNIRARLITSATTQISRDDPKYRLSKDIEKASPEVFEFLCAAVSKLSKVRLTKGGKKSYDHLVSGYFNDILQTLADVFRVLKPSKKAVFVLGDSAPYGVHIPTDEFIGKLGVGIGFHQYGIEVLRTRGGKWKDNPQRHDVQLRESIVTLTKSE